MKITDKQMLDWLGWQGGKKIITPLGTDGIYADRRIAEIETTHGIRAIGNNLREAITMAMKNDAMRKAVIKAEKRKETQ